MEEKQDLRKLLERQNKYAKWQCMLTGVAAVCCVALLVMAVVLLPRLQTVMVNLGSITEELAAADLEGLVEASQAGVEETMDKLNAIDFETLNKAIGDLADVVEPLAKFFNVFN